MKLSSSIPGQRLDGPSSINLRFPPQYRHKLLRLPAEAVVIRQWENRIEPSSITTSRIYFSRMRNYPTSVCSILPYSHSVQGSSKKKPVYEGQKVGDSGPDDDDDDDDTKDSNKFQLPSRDWRGTSYLKWINDMCADECVAYSPSLIDDFHISIDGEKTNPKFDGLTGPVKCTIIQFVQPKALGAKINKNFQYRNPNIPNSLTLTTVSSF